MDVRAILRVDTGFFIWTLLWALLIALTITETSLLLSGKATLKETTHVRYQSLLGGPGYVVKTIH